MAKTTICLGVVLVLLGGLGYVSTGNHARISPVALIPAAVGFVLSILGFLALTDNAKKRMLFMHIAVTIGLLGFLGGLPSVLHYVQMIAQGRQFPNPVIVQEMAAMSALLLFFVLLCVRSFIAARRQRA
jgi:hypothetical protein